MSYTALARRYRSQSFGGMIGQSAVAETLAHAIELDRVHHAYLFCGTRGVGKTSMARLFARALNAPDTIEDGPKPPSGDFPPLEVQQRMAAAIMTGEDMNVIEIDGASNRGVDDARQLIANATLMPTDQARYKIYIIDEVHMLTREAFNALLKLMEEPPSHLKFILCTTEPHKVLPTIHSRCQRFDFSNISSTDIVAHLTDVLSQESVEAEPAVLFEIAKLAQGSMRDALSLLDRLLATGEKILTSQLLSQMLGVADREMIFELVDAIVSSDPAVVLQSVDRLIMGGIAQDQLLVALIEHLRELMLLASCGAESTLVQADGQTREKLIAQANCFDTPILVQIMLLLENVARHSKTSSTPRALLDAAMVRLALSEKFADLASILTGSSSGAVVGEKKKGQLAAKAQAVQRASHATGSSSSVRTEPTPSSPPQEISPKSSPSSGITLKSPPEITPETSSKPLSSEQTPPASSRAVPTPTKSISPPTSSLSSASPPLKKASVEPGRDGDQLAPNLAGTTDIPLNRREVRISDEQQAAVLKHPMVMQVMDLFSARLVSIRPDTSASADE